MSLGARPLGERDVAAICERKMADFQHKARHLRLVHVTPDTYFDAASSDPDLRFAVDAGFMTDLSEELRDPVLIRVEAGQVFTCPALALKVLTDEPPEIHRPFVEGAFLRKLFRLFVPAAFEDGESWEITYQVREIMQRHFAFQLVAFEAVLDRAA
jgi:hypothetical protein